MQRTRKLAETMLLLAPLLTVPFFVRTAQAHGPGGLAYTGTFTLTLPSEVRWGGSAFVPGNYTATIKSTGSPMIALVRTAKGDAVTYVMSGSLSGHTNGVNALLIRERGGQLIVHSLALSDLGVAPIYDPSLAREPVKEARGTMNTYPRGWL